MLAVRTSSGNARYSAAAPTEYDSVFVTARPGRPPLIWFHGNFGTALTDYTNYNAGLRLLAQRYTVIAADLGFNTFGNDTGIARTVEAAAYLAASWGAPGPVTLVGASMGAAVALNYAVRYPENVAAVGLIIPVVDLSAPGPGSAQLNAAYPPAYDDLTAGPTHNPLRFVDDLPEDMPIHLWTSSNDTSVPPSTADAFVAARPQTGRVVFGAYGHGGVDVAIPLVADWLETTP